MTRQLVTNKTDFNVYKTVIFLALIITLDCAVPAIYAATADKKPQLTQYGADNAVCQQKSNLDVVCTYTGNAVFDQQETHLRAPEIIVYKNASNQVYQIFALGNSVNRSYYDSLYSPSDATKNGATTKNNATDQKPINAIADIIKIFPLKNLVTLTGHAHVVRNKDIIEGSYIEYDLNKQTVIATPQHNEHTTIILNSK